MQLLDEFQAIAQYISENVDIPYITEQLEPYLILGIIVGGYILLMACL